jgi:magnesium transporter
MKKSGRGKGGRKRFRIGLVGRKPDIRRSAKTGLPPGTLVHIGERKTEETRLTVMEFTQGGAVDHPVTTPDDVIAFRDCANPVWINVYGLHDVALIEKLGAAWGIHALILEDIVNASQAPHVDIFDDFIYVVMNTVKLVEPPEEADRRDGCCDIPLLDIDQISVVLGRSWVMTFHEEETDSLEPLRSRIRSGHGFSSLSRPDYLAYAIMDMTVDHYFSVLEHIGDAIDVLEDDLNGIPDRTLPARIHTYKSQLLQLRRSVWPARDAVTRLAREEHDLIARDTRPFLRDINDHVLQIIDGIDTQREVLVGQLETHVSGISLRMNEIMKILTIISTIFIPLTFIAGIYGMNFRKMPELEADWGYPLVWVAFCAVAFGLILFFRRKKWI